MKIADNRIDIFGVKYSCLDIEKGIDVIVNNIKTSSYVCFPSVYLILAANKDNLLQEIYNNSLITFIDSKSIEVYARLKGFRGAKNTSGYWLMEYLLQTEFTHYFYGCNDKVLNVLEKKLLAKYPAARILGFKSPPQVELNEIYPNVVVQRDISLINRLKPDFVWIGISSPKQDYLMHHYQKYLDSSIMLGVGAVFLYQAEIINKGPEFLKRLGLRSVWKLFQEPVRHGGKVFPGIAYFIYRVFKQEITSKIISR